MKSIGLEERNLGERIRRLLRKAHVCEEHGRWEEVEYCLWLIEKLEKEREKVDNNGTNRK